MAHKIFQSRFQRYATVGVGVEKEGEEKNFAASFLNFIQFIAFRFTNLEYS